MYKCLSCKNIFEEPNIEITTYEQELGLSSDLLTRTHLTIYRCTSCGNDDIEEFDEEEEVEDE